MSRLNQATPTGVQTTPAVSHEGGAAVTFDDPIRELKLTAVTTYIGEDTFYESASTRLQRLIDLAHDATRRHPREVARFIRKLRTDYKIRTASIVLAVEYAIAGGPTPRTVIDSALQRPDEPAEFVAYWIERTGRRTLPGGIQRGVQDAVARMYTPASYLKYRGARARNVSMADVIELVHPPAIRENQGALYKFILDKAHRGDGDESTVPMLARRSELFRLPESQRRPNLRHLGADGLRKAGITWEALSGWLPDGMDREAWETAIPTMGSMALLRNLRNFDDAGISEGSMNLVRDRLVDVEEMVKARIFPYQVYSAYRAVQTDNWASALNVMFNLATGSLPDVSNSLILVDLSDSMRKPVAQRSDVRRIDIASVMGLSLAKFPGNRVVVFGSESARLNIRQAMSPLKMVDHLTQQIGQVGHSTYGHNAMRAHFRPGEDKRVILFTDDQMRDSPSLSAHVPVILTVNLAGERTVSEAGKGRYNIGGYSDAVFAAMADVIR